MNKEFWYCPNCGAIEYLDLDITKEHTLVECIQYLRSELETLKQRVSNMNYSQDNN